MDPGVEDMPKEYVVPTYTIIGDGIVEERPKVVVGVATKLARNE